MGPVRVRPTHKIWAVPQFDVRQTSVCRSVRLIFDKLKFVGHKLGTVKFWCYLPRAAAFEALSGFFVPSPERDAASVFS